ncbi:hypothetical protein [Levilactobacillus sp. HBUAS67488]|uniref:hypothetical protein n=1 Tax=Levilactobacillus sp. HBUAS67488 TaxID=3109361 RepID=UPI002FEF47C7
MIKQLDFTQDFSSVKFMDTSTSIGLLLTADGAPFDLSACQTLAVQIANEDGYITTRDIDLSNVDDPASGEITMPVDGALMAILTPDDYKIEVWASIKPISIATTSRTATLSIIDGQIEPHTAIFPSDGVLGFTIKENLMNQDGDTIAVISLDEYEQRFSQLESSLEAKVGTLVGPPGPAGPMPDMTGYATTKDVESASTANDNYTDEQFNKAISDISESGAENLVQNSGYPIDLHNWNLYHLSGVSASFVLAKHSFYHNGRDNMFKISNLSANKEAYAVASASPVSPGDRLKIQVKGFQNSDVTSVDIYLSFTDSAGKNVANPALAYGIKFSNIEIKQYSYSYTVPNGAATVAFRIDNNGSVTEGVSADLYFIEPQIAVENVLSPWHPSFLDGQRVKLTSNDGGPLLNIMANGVTDTNAVIMGLNAGFYTVYIQYGAINNPSTDTLRGTIFSTGSGYGNGNFISNASDSFSKFYLAMDPTTGVHWFKVPKATETDPLILGAFHNGADLNNEKTAGSYSNSTAGIKNGPFVDTTYVGWDVTVSNNGHVIHQHAYRKSGESAYRTFWDGSGWGEWQIITPSTFAKQSDLTNAVATMKAYVDSKITTS